MPLSPAPEPALAEPASSRASRPESPYSLGPALATGVLFVHVPKTGGTSVARALYGGAGVGHRTVREVRAELGPRFDGLSTFAVVRDPVDRLASAFRYLKAGGSNRLDAAFAERVLRDVPTLEAFVVGWLTPRTSRAQVHFRPQADFVLDARGRLGVDVLIPYADLAAGYEAVRRRPARATPGPLRRGPRPRRRGLRRRLRPLRLRPPVTRPARSLRVALIGTARYPLREPFVGGLAAHVVGLARGLAERGHDVTLFAPRGSEAAGVRVVPFCVGSGLDFSEAARGDVSMLAAPFMAEHHAAQRLMLGLSRGEWGRFDVVHNHSLHYLPIAMAPTIDAAHVTTLHAPPTPWQESAFACLPEPDRPRAVTVSATNQVTWRRSLPSCGVVRNGVDLGRWAFSGAPDPGLAVWAGRIVPEKGPHLAIEAARAAGLRLRLVGPVHDRAYYEAEVAPRLGPDVEAVGHATHAALAGHYGAAAVALSTARWEEPYGLTLVEALACGTPVAAFRRGAAPELVTDETGRLAEPDCPESLGRAAIEAARLDRRACRRWVEAHASESAMVGHYLGLYRRLAAARPPRVPAALVGAAGLVGGLEAAA